MEAIAVVSEIHSAAGRLLDRAINIAPRSIDHTEYRPDGEGHRA